jgi:hypothetical protein
MRIVLLSAAAVALSGCSWLGLGGNSGSYGHDVGTYKAAKSVDGCNGCTLSRWNVEGGVGVDDIVGGNLTRASKAEAIAGTALTSITMDDAFDRGRRLEIGGSYAMNPNRKVSLTGYNTSANGNRVALGQQGANVVAGDVSDYDAYGLEVGLRQYALPVKAPLIKSVRPYVEARLGAAHVDDIALTNVTRGGVSAANIGLYDSSWVPTGAGLIGLETPVFNRFTMGVETGIRYDGKLKSDESSLAPGTAFAGANSDGARWSVPVTLRGRYRF